MANTGYFINTEVEVIVSGVPTLYTIPYPSTAEEISEITGLTIPQAQTLADTQRELASQCATCFEPLPPNEFYGEFDILPDTPGASAFVNIDGVDDCLIFEIH